MSDPLTNVDIDEVLSSIRRLVSENGHGNAAPQVNATPRKPTVAEDEDRLSKLVLTPDFRVVHPPEAEPAETAQETVEDADDSQDAATIAPNTSEARRMLEETIAELEASVEKDTQDPESTLEKFDIATLAWAGWHGRQLPKSDERGKGNAIDTPDTTADQSAPVVEEEGPTAAHPPQETAPAAESTASEVEEAEVIDAQLTVDPIIEETEVPQSVNATSEDAAEAVIDASPERTQIESQEPHADTVPETEQAEEPEEDTMLDATDSGTSDMADASLGDNDLRDLISDVIRAELEGELGDRVSQNIRKLVRREIFRALAASNINQGD